jgi:hypothetical protein
MIRKHPRKQIPERTLSTRIAGVVRRWFGPSLVAQGAGEEAFKRACESKEGGRFNELLRDYRDKAIALDVARAELNRHQLAIVEALRVFGVVIGAQTHWNGSREMAFSELVPFARRVKVDLDSTKAESERASRDASEAAAAWLLDRAEQHDYESGIPGLICDLAKAIAEGEHLTAASHGELDDLIDTIRKMNTNDWSMPVKAAKGQDDAERRH